MVWKFPDACLDSYGGEVQLIEGHIQAQFTAEMAITAFIKTIAKINEFKHILDFSKNKRITNVIPGYKVNMGFGLHIGWAIEGSIGSHFKIDASYLSPNVNIAARLEAATRQYGIPLLFSGELHSLLSPEY